MATLSEQTVQVWSNMDTLDGYLMKLDTSTYQSKTISSISWELGNDGTASGNVTLGLYEIGSDPWTTRTLLHNFGTKAVPSADNETVTFDTGSYTLSSSGAWAFLDISSVTNPDKLKVWGVDPSSDTPLPAAYDPWLQAYKVRTNDTIGDMSTKWKYNIQSAAASSGGPLLPPPIAMVRL